MNETKPVKADKSEKLQKLTERLDHMVPDPNFLPIKPPVPIKK